MKTSQHLIKQIASVLLTLCIMQSTTAQNTFPSMGNVGIGTLSPATSLQVIGTSRFGSATNYASFDASGNFSFTGTAAYKVAGNKYAFQFSNNANYGLFFNSTNVQYEFRNGSAVPVFLVNANTGNSVFNGTLKIGAYTLPATDGTNGQVLKTNGSGVITWSNDNNTSYTAGTGINIVSGNVINNTAPDQVVTLTGSGSTTVSGTYPNFTINSTSGSGYWTANGTNISNNNTGNVGIGTTTPTHARLEIDSSIGAVVAMFGADKHGVTIEADNPEIGFNYFYNGTTKTIKAGYGANFGMNYGNGDVYIGNFNGSQSSTDFGNITGYQNVITIKQNGSVGIGTSSPAAFTDVELNSNTNQTTALLGRYNYTNNFGIGIGVEGIGNGFGVGVEGIAPVAGYFNGNLQYTGTLSQVSDQKLKENIKPLDNMLARIMQLKPSLYNFKNEYKKMNLPQGQQVGFIAQEMEKVFPQLVETTRNNVLDSGKVFEYKGINYIGLIPILTKAMQELNNANDSLKNNNQILNDKVDQLQSQLNTVLAKINALEQMQQRCAGTVSTSATNQQEAITLSNASYLEQNAPNPFNNKTVIKYYLPANTNNASILITDANGHALKTITLAATKGEGQITLSANTLASGNYFYSLLVDGKKIDTKQMVLTK